MDEYDEDENPSVSEGPLPTGTQESTGGDGGWVPHLDQQGSTQLAIVMLELCPFDSQGGVLCCSERPLYIT